MEGGIAGKVFMGREWETTGRQQGGDRRHNDEWNGDIFDRFVLRGIRHVHPAGRLVVWE
jgi:hypothetical protein